MAPTVYGLWIASWIGASALIGYIWKKKLNREFPIFFAFLVAETLSDLLNFVMSCVYKPGYYYSYWTGIAATTCLGFFVLQEIFRHIFRPYESLRTFGSTLFRWSTLVLLMVGVIMAMSSALRDVRRSRITSSPLIAACS